MLERLGLHYRRMLLCAGDMGFSSAKTYDLEVWLPGQGLFREISSCSNFESFQARRANIRYKPEGRREPSSCTPSMAAAWQSDAPGSPLSRIFSKDGSVLIPQVLRPYIGVEKIEARKL